MGVTGFFPFVAAKAPAAIELIKESSALHNARVGIDMPVLMHRAKSSDSTPFVFLTYIAAKVEWLRSLDIQPLFVFDGISPPAKSEEETRRRNARAKAAAAASTIQLQLEQAGVETDVSELQSKAERLARAAVSVTPADDVLAQRLLEALGAAWCVADGEAERYLAGLQRAGTVDEIATEDSDALVCGATSIIRNFWALHYPAAGNASRVLRRPIIEALGLTDETLTLACVLAGCDFAPKLKGVGMVKAVAAAKKHDSDLQACLQHLGYPGISPNEKLRFTVATQLLGAVAPILCETAPRLSPRRGALLQVLLEEIEELGEPWLLRSVFADWQTVHAKAQRTLVPEAWRFCALNDAQRVCEL